MRTPRISIKQAIAIQEQGEQLRQWAIQRGMTPLERYKLGPTGTWHTAKEYYTEILPLWCPHSKAWNYLIPRLFPRSSYETLVRGGIVDTNYVAMRDIFLGTSRTIYICDSAKTRDIFTRLQSFPLKGMAWAYIKTQLVQITFEEGWLGLFRQVIALRRKLEQPGWKELLDGQCINLQNYIKPGEYIDKGLMPPDLLAVALRLVNVWLLDYLVRDHPSAGWIRLSEKGGNRRIYLLWGYRQLVPHRKHMLVDFYRANINKSHATFRRINKH